jgi:hypothetical protein
MALNGIALALLRAGRSDKGWGPSCSAGIMPRYGITQPQAIRLYSSAELAGFDKVTSAVRNFQIEESRAALQFRRQPY